MNKIVYINKQYRSYDLIKYKTLIDNYDLTVVWICEFRSDDLPEQSLLKNLNYFVLGLKKSRLQPWHLVVNFKLLNILLRLKNQNLIISSTSDSWHSKVAFVASKLKSVKIVFRKEVWFYSNINSVFVKLNRKLTTYIEENAKAIFVPGFKQIELLKKTHNNSTIKTFIFPYLLDSSVFNPIQNNENSSIISFVYWGRIIPLKGVDILIKAINHLSKDYKNIQAIIIGGETDQIYQKDKAVGYFEYCKKLALDKKNITFLGSIKNSDLKSFLPLKSIFVMPNVKYFNNSLVGDGWGNALIESLGFGLPVIASDRVSSAFSGVIEGKNGFILNSDFLLEKLIERMQFFIENPNSISEYGKYSRKLFIKINNKEQLISSVNAIL